uniref:Uncharacterized protein n=1 Tax=Cacopsylla melanoneura TaxID=428564 RepID=A0A8D9B3B4_9HEMI
MIWRESDHLASAASVQRLICDLQPNQACHSVFSHRQKTSFFLQGRGCVLLHCIVYSGSSLLLTTLSAYLLLIASEAGLQMLQQGLGFSFRVFLPLASVRDCLFEKNIV